jgi:hypothetical protein
MANHKNFSQDSLTSRLRNKNLGPLQYKTEVLNHSTVMFSFVIISSRVFIQEHSLPYLLKNLKNLVILSPL